MSNEKAQFRSELVLTDIDGHTWLVHEPLRFFSQELSMTLVVPAGTKTDLASIPRWVRYIPFVEKFLPQSGKYNRAAVLHDSAYSHVLTNSHGYRILLSKEAADKLFLEAMLADGVASKSAKTMYLAVKLFGIPEPIPVEA